jgi:molecular chaperone Hsp33
MADGVIRALLDGNLLVSLAVVTEAAREARARHRLQSVSASLLGQGLAGGVLLGSLQKSESRINLQVECDGPLAGFFVDATATGDCRGYAKNPGLQIELGEGPFRWRAALGNSGFLSVLRDVGHEFYRSSVQLEAMNVAGDLERYFAISDQVPTKVAIDVRHDAGEALGAVVGVLVQSLPNGELKALEDLGHELSARLTQALQHQADATPQGLLGELFPGVEPTMEYPVAFRCTCSRERVLRTMLSLGAAELQDIVDTMGSTAVTCQFCATKREVSLGDLFDLLAQLGVTQPN